MKRIFLLLLFPYVLWSQQAYYQHVDLTTTGLALKQELSQKISSTHNQLSYSNIWEACKITDVNPENSSEVILIYGYEPGNDSDFTNDRERDINKNGGGTTDWNREHVFAKSLGNPNLGTSGAGADAFNLRPSDVRYNSTRSNRKFANASGNSGVTGSYWYPGDEWKGDVARIIMYMYVRYGNRCLPSSIGVGSSSATPDDMIDLFLEWNVEDPVSDFEQKRNTYHDSNGTYAQGNRNPFIDNPYLATLIWGGRPAQDRWEMEDTDEDFESPTAPTNLSVNTLQSTSIRLSWTAAIDNVGITSYDIYVNGTLNASVTTNNSIITGLAPETTYSFYVVAKDANGNISTNSNTVQGTTTKEVQNGGNTGTTADDIFFSEYVEGSGFNKAVEIANFTSATVDLAHYDIRKQSNGSGNWAAVYTLSGTLDSGDVIVFVNADVGSTDLKNKADVLIEDDYPTNPSPLNYNGNDAVGLFKNDVLIDVIGVFNSSEKFGENATLRRKSNIDKPNTSFDKELEWEVLNIDDFSGLGTHELETDLTNNLIENAGIIIYTQKASLRLENTAKAVWIKEIKVYDVFGKLHVKKTINTANNFTISNLPNGVLIVVLETNKSIYTSKIVVKL